MLKKWSLKSNHRIKKKTTCYLCSLFFYLILLNNLTLEFFLPFLLYIYFFIFIYKATKGKEKERGKPSFFSYGKTISTGSHGILPKGQKTGNPQKPEIFSEEEKHPFTGEKHQGRKSHIHLPKKERQQGRTLVSMTIS